MKHEVLNAKNHEREAEIIAQAGRKGAVTVSTNMAGRGTDIQLGGNPDFLAREFLRGENKDPDTIPREEWEAVLKTMKEQVKKEHDEVAALGGLHVVGTARHESRRIDNQLRGRAARQGDPGSTRFYLSLEDNLVRIFGGDRLKGMMQKLGMQDDEPIESKLLSKLIESAQKGVEDRNFSARKNLLEYDDVMNMQRKIIYTMRGALLEGETQSDRIDSMISNGVTAVLDQRLPVKSASYTWDLEGLGSDLMTRFGVKVDVSKFDSMDRKKVEETLNEQLGTLYKQKTELVGAEQMRGIEQMIMLSIIDSEWKDHLLRMDDLKQGIGWRGYGQKDPLQEYKREAYEMFEGMFYAIESESVRSLFTFQISQPDYVVKPQPQPQPEKQPAPVASPANPFADAAAPAVKSAVEPTVMPVVTTAVIPETPVVPVTRVLPPKAAPGGATGP